MLREGLRGDLEEEDGEGLEWWRVEESGRKGGFSGSEQVGEVLEDGHLVDKFCDVMDFRGLGTMDLSEDR